MQLHVKHVYDEATDADGFRVLVDRLWPRGLSKERARVDLWAKEVAPSAELRRAVHHEGMSWPDFSARYRDELAADGGVARVRDEIAGHAVVTLLFASHDEEHNGAVVLQELLGASE
ncbi:DUF488 domain-containing protein [Microbacterium dextranolyticum]|nr:DUF488 family protein [Microbacterium dextranolyticum]MBM7464220.1 uncharacterized protein YeaO (DUF488 family) [Microbacterium dextranolyticum]